MRKVTSTLFFAASMFSATSAFAQIETFGDQGTVAFSADRLFSFFKAGYTHENANGDETCGGDGQPDCDATGIGFGMNAGGGVFGFPYNYPRFAFDYFVIDKLNIGGSIAYASLDTDNGGGEAFLFSPRVGYFIGISGAFGFWPRGGFTYHSVDPDGGGNDTSGFGLTLEAMFAVAPVEHFAFLFGPTFDIDFAGSTEQACADDDDCKFRQRSFGIQVGLMGWL